MKRLLRLTSHTGYARYLASLSDGELGWIVRQDIPSPYAFGPTHVVLHDQARGPIIIVETSHRRYDVFAVDHEVTCVYATDELATEAYVKALAKVPYPMGGFSAAYTAELARVKKEDGLTWAGYPLTWGDEG